jgi:hypothetical protein
MRTATAVVAVVALVASSATASAAGPKLPAAVANDLQTIAADCTGVGGKALTQDAVKRVDLNGDGKEDYVLDVGSIICDGAASAYGDRAKGITVYAGDGAGGAKSAFSGWVYGARIEGNGPQARLWLTVSGAECGKKPAPTFASESFCERPIAWNAAVRKFEFALVSTVKMIE